MKDNSDNSTSVSGRALEIIMRDVMDGLFELSLESSYRAHAGDLQILEIRPEQTFRKQESASAEQALKAEIINFPRLRRACG